MTPDILQVDHLDVAYRGADGAVPVVKGVSFTLGREKLAVVGESGSGKSTVGRTLLRLLPRDAQVRARRLRFDGVDLLAASERQMSQLRGSQLSMIMQDPKYSLNPVMTVGAQIGEAVLRAGVPGRAACRERVEQLLARVHIREPARVALQHPHQLSGGMGQRVMIAMMLAQKPRLLMAEEGLALLFITHDLHLVGRFCDRVLVMYAGRVVESLRAAELPQAQHPYTRALLTAVPSLKQRRSVLPVLQRDPAWSAA
jgi:peptide/nickel transport system ATP-binding protein